MSEENSIEENTINGQLDMQTEVPAQESSPTQQEQVSPISRQPEFGDHVLYVDGERTLDATVQVAFTDGRVNLRVDDPTSPFGYFDVSNVVQDANKAHGTFHFIGEN